MPTPVTITGAVGTGNTLQANRRVAVKSRILDLQPNTAPFVVLLDKVTNSPVSNPEFSWFEQDLEPRFDQVNNGAGITNVATSIVVDNGSYFAQHDLVYVPRTGETFRVTAVATNTLTVVRGVGSTAAAMNDNEELIITSSAQPEGDTSKPARSGIPAKLVNYTQIFREPYEATETWVHSDTYTTPDDWSRQGQQKGIEHKKEIEYALWLGHPSEDLTGSQPRRTTGGARHYITTNVTDMGGAMTEAELFAFLRPVLRYGNASDKMLFAGSLPLSIISQFANSKLNTRPGDQTYGLDIRQLVTAVGTINLALDNLLEGTTLGGEMYVIDMSQLEYRYLSNSKGSRDTHLRTNIQAPDADTQKNEYLTEAGLVFGQEKMHGRATNITSAG